MSRKLLRDVPTDGCFMSDIPGYENRIIQKTSVRDESRRNHPVRHQIRVLPTPAHAEKFMLQDETIKVKYPLNQDEQYAAMNLLMHVAVNHSPTPSMEEEESDVNESFHNAIKKQQDIASTFEAPPKDKQIDAIVQNIFERANAELEAFHPRKQNDVEETFRKTSIEQSFEEKIMPWTSGQTNENHSFFETITTERLNNQHDSINELRNELYDYNDETREQLSDDIDRVEVNTQEEIERLDDSMEELSGEVDSLADDLDLLTNDSSDITNRLNEIECILDDLQEEREDKMKTEEMVHVSNVENSFRKQAVENQLANAKGSGGMKGMSGMLQGFKNQFGKVENQFAFAPTENTLALKKPDGTFVSYKDNQLTDVNNLVLDFQVPAFKLPTSAKDVKVGDVVLNNNAYQYVTKKYENHVQTVDPVNHSHGTVMPTKNLMMADPFYTVVKTLDFASNNQGFDPMFLMAASNGNTDDLLPFLMMGQGFGGGDNQSFNPMMLMMMKDNMDDMLPFLFMQQGGVAKDGFNPMMMLMMMQGEDSSMKDMLPFMMMQQQGNTQVKVEDPNKDK